MRLQVIIDVAKQLSDAHGEHDIETILRDRLRDFGDVVDVERDWADPT